MNATTNPPMVSWEALDPVEQNEIHKGFRDNACRHTDFDGHSAYDAFRKAIYDAEQDGEHSPHMQDWNNYPKHVRAALSDEWDIVSCPNDGCNGDILGFHRSVTTVLKKRERRIFECTMASP